MNRELVLPPGTHAFVLDTTKGKVSVYVGPTKNSLSETDQPVVWDPESQRYMNVDSTDRATCVWALAEEGEYIVLRNPAPESGQAHPAKGTSTEAGDLEMGRQVIVSGPATFPLWPGQTAQTIPGHHLRHNQYVIVQVVDPALAEANWTSAVIAPQVTTSVIDSTAPTQQGDGEGEGAVGSDEQASSAPEAAPPSSVVGLPGEASELTMGQLMVVPGTHVSFYMPSTGLMVVPDDRGNYVRDAVTLETLEYCILLDEGGQKRYVRGPAVVFPSPTETFKTNDRNGRVFQAIELNEQSGLYVKVIAEYEEEGETRRVGDELFIRGSDQAIYFPRAEHSIITYDGRQKHHAIAIPAGEGRYVLNRMNGQVILVTGPNMFLPDPRTQVVVRRILDLHDVELMYPGNAEALRVNQRYQVESEQLGEGEPFLSRATALGDASAMSPRFRGSDQDYAGDTLPRGTTHTPPRTITLDTKYEGAVGISIWPGYAVLVTNKTGDRRVEVGPKVVLLQYDEIITALELSTGRPKSDRNLLRTGYLRVVNNVVSDLVTVETRDLVSIEIELSYRVNFEGVSNAERLRWFDVENYVQVLTDHCRSRLRRVAKIYGVTELYAGAIDIIRDALLGEAPSNPGASRAGLRFPENGMKVTDVEVLDVRIDDPEVEGLLGNAQSKALEGAIRLSIAEEDASRERRLQQLARETAEEQHLTAEARAELALKVVELDLEQALAQAKAKLQESREVAKVNELDLANARKRTEQEIALQRQRDEIELERLTAETTQLVARMAAFEPGLIAAMTSLTDHALVKDIVTAIGPAAIAAGVSTADMLATLFEGTPLESVIKVFAERPLAPTGASALGSGEDAWQTD